MSVICLYFASFVPGIELTLYAVSSFFVTAMVVETGPRGGILLAVAVSILGFFLIPNKLGILPYIFFFGVYPVGKYFAEKPKKVAVQLLVKIAFYVIIFGTALFFFKELFFGNIRLPGYPVGVLLAGGGVMFLLYDYILTLFVRFYHSRIKKDRGEIKLS